MIDATKLSVAELMALADAERQNAERHNCCDWGGGGCDPVLARKLMGWGKPGGESAMSHIMLGQTQDVVDP